MTPTPGATAPAERGSVAPSGDAIRLDVDASYERAATAPLVDDHDRAVVSEQIGRPARGQTAVVDRCAFGLPTVVRVGPRLDDGTPFPTVFWLTCPVLSSAIGTLEGDGEMRALTDRLGRDEEFASGYADAAARYVAFRDTLGDPLPGDPTAGGMPDYVKCLHVHVAHTLATSDNPVGRWALDRLSPVACRGPCVVDVDDRDAGSSPDRPDSGRGDS